MDAARGLMGQGWPFQAGPRNDDATREPQRSWGRMSGLDLLVTFGAMPKVTRSTERNRAHRQLSNADEPIMGMGYAHYFRDMARSHRYCFDGRPPHLAAKISGHVAKHSKGSSEEIGHEHPAARHVVAVGVAEISQRLTLLDARGEPQQHAGRHRQQHHECGRLLPGDAPGEQQQ